MHHNFIIFPLVTTQIILISSFSPDKLYNKKTCSMTMPTPLPEKMHKRSQFYLLRQQQHISFLLWSHGKLWERGSSSTSTQHRYSHEGQGTETFCSLELLSLRGGQAGQNSICLYFLFSYRFEFCWIWNYMKVPSGRCNASLSKFLNNNKQLISMYKMTQQKNNSLAEERIKTQFWSFSLFI